MKWSVSDHRHKKYAHLLVVDGYNIVPRLARRDLASVEDLDGVRNQLIDSLGEYRAFAGVDVIVVFDAHKTAEAATHFVRAGVEVMFTYASETADDRIERVVYELRDTYREISVATSDMAEQQVVFGKGALRMPADELLRKLEECQRRIRNALATQNVHGQRIPISDTVRQDVAKILEIWRRQ